MDYRLKDKYLCAAMKYKLGDFVRFVDEKIEGYVTRIFDDQMIGVTGEDDFEIPVLAAKVTQVHGRGKNAEGPQSGATEVTADANFVTTGVYLAVVSDARAKTVVHFHLINQTSFQLLTTLGTAAANKFKGEFAGSVMPGSTEKIYSAQLNELDQWPRININILYHTPKNIEPPKPIAFGEKFRAKDFAGAKKTAPILNEPAWLIQLDQAELVIDAQKLKESFHKPAEEKLQLERPPKEIDLHIEKLVPDHQLLSSAEILHIQLNYFNKVLDAAIVHQLPEIVFIHGAGNGVLKNEIHKKLSKNNKVKTFMDAHKEKFGYGATRVMLK